MNIQSIKNRANGVLLPYRSQFIRVLIIVMVLQSIPSLLTADNAIIQLLSTILSIVFIPVAHGVIVSSLKIVRNNGQSVNDQDGFVGFKRFKELFPTYIITSLIVFLAMFIAGMVLAFASMLLLSSSLASLSVMATTDMNALLTMLLANPLFLLVVLLVTIVIFVLSIVLDALLLAVPYLLEQYHITGMEAVKMSYAMMKNHILDYVKLYFSFFGWMFLSALIEGFLSQIVPFTVAVSVIVGLFQIFTYYPTYCLSEAVLFEEIAFYHFNQVGE